MHHSPKTYPEATPNASKSQNRALSSPSGGIFGPQPKQNKPEIFDDCLPLIKHTKGWCV
jgi:hypothetical protein